MSSAPVICFGQQPCGFFPKRFLVAKINTARRLQKEIGGEIVFFYHDSDHDPRETRTLLRHRKTQEPAQLNFSFDNRLQRKFSPLYLKRIPEGWQRKTVLQLPNYVDWRQIEIFQKVVVSNAADFCLEMYRAMGLLEGIRIMRSSQPALRLAAYDIVEFFVDVPFEGEVVRARFRNGQFQLHEGGDSYVSIPATAFSKEQISPTRDSRLCWMQSIVHCTHYVAGLGEMAYLRPEETPEITFVKRETIEQPNEACTEIPP
jgi:hypothetical protein